MNKKQSNKKTTTSKKKSSTKKKSNIRNKKGSNIKNEFGLNPMQSRFCEYYITEQNARESYIKAGYKARGGSASANASRMLNNDKIKSYINYLMEQARSKAVATKQEILEHLTSVMRGEVKDQYADIPGVRDRTEAAKLLGKEFGMFNDKVEVQGNVKHQHSGPTKADELIADMFDTKNDNASKVS